MRKEVKKGNDRKSARNGAKSGSSSEEPGTIDKVRDLLFGQSVQEMNSQVATVQNRLLAALDDAKQDTLRRFDQLESYIKAENKALQESIKQETKGRNAALSQVEQSLAKLGKDLAAENASREKASSELRDQILQQGKELASSIDHTATTLKAELDQESSKLNKDLASRSSLAAMFSDLAIQLSETD